MKYNLNFINYFKKFNFLSLVLVSLSLFFVLFKGLNYGIDFKGGTLIEVRVQNNDIRVSDIRDSLIQLNLGDVNVKNFGEKKDFLIKIEKKLNNNDSFISEIKTSLDQDLSEEVNYRRVESVGPKVSAELLKSGIISIGLALLMMLFYIWFRFEWQFGIGAICALVHDIIITIGVFSLLQLEFNLSIIAALLTIVGYSLNDTVVIYDRIREELRKYKKMPIMDLINQALNLTLSRTLMTSITTLLALFSLYLFGGEVIKGFTFAMIWGVLIGTYSSIFIASPILIGLNIKRDWSKKNEE